MIKFTDRTTQGMRFAQEYARSVNHEYVGTEHILMGLLKDSGSVASDFLRDVGLTIDKLEKEIRLVVQPGPDFVIHSKLPLTPRSKQVVESAMNFAQEFKHDYLGPEHLLLGVLSENQGVASSVLGRLGLPCPELQKQLLHLLGQGEKEPEPEPEPISHKTAIEQIRSILDKTPKPMMGICSPEQNALRQIREVVCNIS